MGRVKITMIKRISLEMLDKHRDIFTTDFSKNKEFVEKTVTIPSKKVRNLIAGYITRLMKIKAE